MATQPSIEKLRALETGAVVTLRARVVGYHDGLTSLRDHSGSVEAERDDATPIGSWVELEGLWDGNIIRPTRWTVVQRPTGDFPALHSDWARLQDRQGLGVRRLQDRAKAMRATRSFFDAQDFCELETPSCVPSPGLDFHLDAFGMAGSPKERWLITSPEYQMKRALSAGLPRIFQLCHCFRRDESGIHHDPEFTMLEWYRSFAGSAEVMQDTEELVQHLAIALIGKTRLPKGLNVAAPWPRRRVEDVLREHTGLALSDFTDDDAFFRIWVEKVEPQLGLNTPVFITHWPARMASLARLIPDEPQYADRFEAYAHGLELCNGFGELVDAAEQRRRLENDRQARINAGRPAYPIDERFLLALEEGIPPSGGNALGFDRLLMLLLGAESIAEVMAFPESHR